MKTIQQFLMALSATALIPQIAATTLTWTGGTTSDGAFTHAANWSPAQTPRPGDVLIVNDAVTFGNATFDVGNEGLTIQNTAKVICRVAFSGSGDIIIQNKGRDGFFQSTACPDFSGSWRIRYGKFEPQTATLGSGTVIVEAGSTGGQLQIGNTELANNVLVCGATSATSVNFTNPGALLGTLTSDADFTIAIAWGNPRISSIQGGHTVTLKCGTHTMSFTGTIDATITKYGTGKLYLADTSETSKMSLILQEGTIESSTISVFAALSIGESSLAKGIYRTTDLPAALVGNGIALVGGKIATWVGGSSGAWAEGKNWTTGTAPMGLTIAKFTNAVELANETFDFGDDGVFIWNIEQADLIQRTMFAGSGQYRKFGSGQIDYCAESSYTGGTLFMDGIARIATPKTNLVFGAAESPVMFECNSTGTKPSINLGTYDISFPYQLHLKGSLTNERIVLTNHAWLRGSIHSDADFTIRSKYGVVDGSTCDISAPGKTLTFIANDNASISSLRTVNASLLKKGTVTLRLLGHSPGAENTLIVDDGTVILEKEATWVGNIEIRSNGQLNLTADGNCSPEASFSIASGGRVEIAEGTTVHIRRLMVDGKAIAPGNYTTRSLPSILLGNGRLTIGRGGFIITIR